MVCFPVGKVGQRELREGKVGINDAGRGGEHITQCTDECVIEFYLL